MGRGSADALRGSVFVVDGSGEVFAKLRKAALGVPLLRARTGEAPPSDARLIVVATPPVEWQSVIGLASQAHTLVISRRATDDEAQHALAMGAVGYIATSMPRSSFRRAVLAAIAGDPVFSRRTLVAAMQSRPRAIGATAWLKLTTRQREVLALIAQGAADKEIGARLGISPATAQKHAASLVKRLGVPNRAAAAASAYVGAH